MNESSSIKSAESSIIDISNLCLTFETQTEPVHALSDINMKVNSGDFVSLIGPSGCGKTTLLNCIAGLLDLDDGQIIIEGDNVTWKEPKDRHIGMVFQSYALYPSMSVEKNLSFGLRMSNTPKSIISEKIDKASEFNIIPYSPNNNIFE